MSVRAGAARRYARALLEVALAQGAGPEVRDGLRAAAAAVAGHRELRAVLAHPAVGADRKRSVIETVWKDQPELVRRLVTLLAGRQRMELLPEIERVYGSLWNAHRGVVSAEAVSARPLGEDQRRALAQKLRQRLGREVELTARVSPELLGGLVLKMEGRVYDGSVRGKLRALRARLAGEAEGA